MYLFTSPYLLLLPQTMHPEQHTELSPLVQQVIQSLRQLKYQQ